MSSIDYLILALLLLSVGIGLWRGFVREALSLLVWVAAFWVAFVGAGIVEVYLAAWIGDQGLRLALAFVLLFLSVHVIGFVVARLLSTVIKSIGLRGVDRVAGGGFGLARGLVIIAVLVLLAEMTPMTREPVWQESFMVAKVKQGMDWLQLNYPLDKLGHAIAETRGELF